jgi:hypothetical protein
MPCRPKHPLSAYNLFFQSERARLIEEATRSETAFRETDTCDANGNAVNISQLPLSSSQSPPWKSSSTRGRKRCPQSLGGFAGLARGVAAQWKKLDAATKASFEDRARLDRCRYRDELATWKRRKDVVADPIGGHGDWLTTLAIMDSTGSIAEATTAAAKLAPLEKSRWVTPVKSATRAAGGAIVAPITSSTPYSSMSLAELDAATQSLFPHLDSLKPSTILSPSIGSRFSAFDPASVLDTVAKLARLEKEQTQDRIEPTRLADDLCHASLPQFNLERRADQTTMSNHDSVIFDRENTEAFARAAVQRDLFPECTTPVELDNQAVDTSLPALKDHVNADEMAFELQHLDPHFGLRSPHSWLEHDE